MGFLMRVYLICKIYPIDELVKSSIAGNSWRITEIDNAAEDWKMAMIRFIIELVTAGVVTSEKRHLHRILNRFAN